MSQNDKIYSNIPITNNTSPAPLVCEQAEPLPSFPFSSEPSLSTLNALSVSALAECCIQEINSYHQGDSSIDQYGVELFRRAIVQGNQDARQAVQQCFSETVRDWLHRHPQREVAYRLTSEEDYIAQSFERFWQATAHHAQSEFSTLSALLRFMCASLNAVILDTLRTYSRPGERNSPRSIGRLQGEDMFDSSELWDLILQILPNKDEQHLAYLLFHCGLKPMEILHFFPHEFSDVQVIYRLRCNIMQRLSCFMGISSASVY